MPPESKLNGGGGNEGARGFGKILEALGETPIASEPGESALDHPAARQDDEALPFMLSLRLTISARSGGTFATATSTLPGVIAAIGPEAARSSKRVPDGTEAGDVRAFKGHAAFHARKSGSQ